ncbi:MAG: sensor histidine kinase N-terminal domain-containing protein [Gammaproteobacteria bacterium]|nr:sensor histidine kinase N-terminal domain-containing protein [Gammaproteobacteria bacterium]
MNPSLRNRLLFTLLPVTLALWAIVGVVIYAATQSEVDELIDAQLAQSARVLLSLMGHELAEEELRPGYTSEDDIAEQFSEFSHKYEQRLAFQMWILAEDRIWLRTATAPRSRMSERSAGFEDRIIEGDPWRVYVLTDPAGRLQVQVGESSARREELRNYIAWRVLIPILLTVPLLAILIWYGVGRAMMPLSKIADDVKNRRLDNLHPIPDIAVPVEAKPLIDALNALFQRLQQAFETERRFTSDAAHELRTPLAALKTQAQVALRATADDERRRALHQVITGVDRATHLAQQLLTLARIDPTLWVGRDKVDLGQLASEVLAEIAPVALAKDSELSLEASTSAPVQGDRAMLGIMLRNLVDNAIKYTPIGGKIEVRVVQRGSSAVLSVTDNGPGIPLEERNRVFERFYRQIGASAPGSGLGLSIVKRIADLHHAEIRLDAVEPGGLSVEVVFGDSA